jgi:type II secretory pathway pseudopilin PulG
MENIILAVSIIILILLFLLFKKLKRRQARKREKKLLKNIEKRREFIIAYAPKIYHPWKNIGSRDGFIINGEEGPTLSLKRNIPYKFTYASPSTIHPLYFTTSETGGETLGKINGSTEIGRDNNNSCHVDGTTIVTFDKKYPDHFFYQSSDSRSTGGRIILQN